MKTQIIIAALAAITLSSCRKDSIEPQRPPVQVSKTVNFSVFQSSDYSDPAFDGVMAELKLAVSKVQKNTGQLTTLWDSTIAFQPLQAFPRTQMPGSVTKVFSGIQDEKETLQASYHIRYRDAQNRVSGTGKNEFAGIGTSILTLPVRL